MAQRLRVQTALVKDDSIPSVYHTHNLKCGSASQSLLCKSNDLSLIPRTHVNVDGPKVFL